jgi:hypothetical protein
LSALTIIIKHLCQLLLSIIVIVECDYCTVAVEVGIVASLLALVSALECGLVVASNGALAALSHRPAFSQG